MPVRFSTTLAEETSPVWVPAGVTTFYVEDIQQGAQIKVQVGADAVATFWQTIATLHAGNLTARFEQVGAMRLVVSGNEPGNSLLIFEEVAT